MVVAGLNLANLQMIYQIFSFCVCHLVVNCLGKKYRQTIKCEFVLALSRLGLNEEWSCKGVNHQMLGSFLFQSINQPINQSERFLIVHLKNEILMF